jgi:hypothetical protein
VGRMRTGRQLRRRWRMGGALVVVVLAAVVGPPTALADAGLPGVPLLDAGSNDGPVTNTVTTTVETLTTKVVPEPATPVAALPETPPAVVETTRIVQEAAAPVVEAVTTVVEEPTAVLPAPVAQTLDPVLAQVRATAAPALGAANQVVRRVTADVSEVTRTVEQAAGSAPVRDTGGTESAQACGADRRPCRDERRVTARAGHGSTGDARGCLRRTRPPETRRSAPGRPSFLFERAGGRSLRAGAG